MEQFLNVIASIRKPTIDKTVKVIYLLIIFFLPTQLGKHFWPSFSIVSGLRIDYLSPTIYFTDILIVLLALVSLLHKVFLVKPRTPKPEIRKKIQNTKLPNSKRLMSVRLFKFVSDPLLRQASDGTWFRASDFILHKWVIMFFAISLVVGIVFSARPLAGAYGLFKLGEFAFFAWVSTRILAKEKIFQQMIIVFAGSMILQSLLAVVQFYHQGSLGGVMYYLGERMFTAVTPGIANASLNGALLLRPYGTLPHPNVLAGYLLIGMFLLISNIKTHTSKTEKTLMFSSIVVSAVALILSMSRTAILYGSVIMFIFLAKIILQKFQQLHQSKKNTGNVLRNIATTREWRRTSVKVSAVILGLFIFAIITLPLTPRFLSFNLGEEAVVQREDLALAAWQMFLGHPLLGVGLNQFLIQLPYQISTQRGSMLLQPVHDIYLLIAAETGIIGFLCFLYFLFVTLVRLRLSEDPRKSGIALVFFTVLILGLGDHYFITLQQGRLLFAFVIGLCFITSLLKHKTRNT
jgi:hypothetical protein